MRNVLVGYGRGVLTRGLITLAVSTVSIDLPQYTNSIFLTTVLWVMGDERVSFGILLLAFSRFFVSHSVCHDAQSVGVSCVTWFI